MASDCCSGSEESSSKSAGPLHEGSNTFTEPTAHRPPPSHYQCQQPCFLCAKLPLKYRGLLNSMPQCDGAELWDYFDAGYFELMLGGAAVDRQHHNEAKVNHRAASVAAEKAQKHLKKLQKELAEMGLIKQPDQRFTGASEKARLMAPFQKGEIVFGMQLGTGGFSSVYEVEAFRPDAELSEELHPLEDAARDFLAKHARRRPQDQFIESSSSPEEELFYKRQRKRYLPQTRYAVKHLKYSLVEDPDKFEKAAVDIALEAQLLLVMDHPHIISLRGWTRHGTNAFRSGCPSDYFLILDRLPEILDERIYLWRHSLIKYKARVKIPWCKKKFAVKINQLFIERLNVAHDVASAIEYMHERRIINRDLKTSNIGFDFHGEVKLFDLGLSRLMPKEKYKLDDGYVMSRVGTKATMAPEVRRKLPYDLSADVYSYGVVLWEILTLSTSTEYFRKLKKEERRRLEDGDQDEESDDDYLPLPICTCWPKVMQDLVRQCLMYDPKARPSMKVVRRTLGNQMEALGFTLAKHQRQRRRSTFRLDLSKMDIDEFSKTSVDSSLKEPGSSTDFKSLCMKGNVSPLSTTATVATAATATMDNATTTTSKDQEVTLEEEANATSTVALALPSRMTDTGSDSPPPILP